MKIIKIDPTEWANISVGSDHIRREIEHIIIIKKRKREPILIWLKLL